MFRAFATQFAQMRTRSRDVRKLRMMGDRELADIGLLRTEIEDAVRWGRR
ncbi:DUF1127 domain-containing protein [Fulvimarina sp. MAC3]